MNLIAAIMATLKEREPDFGPLQSVAFHCNGTGRAIWATHTEEFQTAELVQLVQPAPEWQVKLGQALAHQAKGELAEARRLELEVQDALLADAKTKIKNATTQPHPPRSNV